ncbi:hypothetical protein [Vibrio caribbeanicus]|uniref:hypothetical protein n=1 Tax=Vibrio caribbeanicus TaxID=701175 RepID=UPI0022837416|nr:hypothetical protein [Vibrio caribbeanicus]MCY9843801.1 hypothetical protein [Vibrio caribbeanicus]
MFNLTPEKAMDECLASQGVPEEERANTVARLINFLAETEKEQTSTVHKEKIQKVIQKIISLERALRSLPEKVTNAIWSSYYQMVIPRDFWLSSKEHSGLDFKGSADTEEAKEPDLSAYDFFIPLSHLLAACRKALKDKLPSKDSTRYQALAKSLEYLGHSYGFQVNKKLIIDFIAAATGKDPDTIKKQLSRLKIERTVCTKKAHW